jgi:glycosyltransferase involved in cell wall biosynthesis
MNIVLVNPEYPSPNGKGHGGIATYIYIMANALTDIGQNVTVLVRKGTIPENLDDSVKFFSYDFISPSKLFSSILQIYNNKIFWERGCSKAVFNIIRDLHKESPIDVVEIPEYNGIVSQFAKTLPFSRVVNFHTPSFLIDQFNQVSMTAKEKQWYDYEKKALKNCNAFRCPSKAMAKRASDLFSIPLDDITIIRNPVSPLIFKKFKQKPPSMRDNICEILFSGRLERRKGAEVMLNSIKDILKINKQIHITFAGETEIGGSVDYRQTIERFLEPEERDRVWFLGSITREKLSLLYRRSDIFIIPSIFENAPYTLLEAMSAKLPVVGADTDGINEIIQHKKTGLLFSLDSTEELCTCIKELFTNRELRERLADNAYNHVKVYYNPNDIAKKTVEFYQAVIKNK